MATGTLQARFNDRGFTFIEPDPDGDNPLGSAVFLHINQLKPGEDAKAYVRGVRVEYQVTMVSDKGVLKPKAQSARILVGSAAVIGSAEIVKTALRGRPKFWAPTYGFVTDEASGLEYFVSADDAPGGYLREGDALQFDVERTEDAFRAINVKILDWAATGEPFTDLLDMGRADWVIQLTAMAENEDWNYTVRPSKDRFTVLRSYIKYTFLRLNELDGYIRTSADGTTLSFNTGLVSSFQEQIFALFRKRPESDLGPPWVLRNFEKASSVSFLQHFGGALPPLAWYHSSPSELVLDTSVPLVMNVEHVPHDPDRFPDSLKSLSPQDLAALVNSKAPEAIERVRRNYKTAIPQFYRDGRTGVGKMQFLLPVALLRRDSVELALTVDRLEHNYLGRTVLPLDWAYNNARLLTRPDRDWLRP